MQNSLAAMKTLIEYRPNCIVKIIGISAADIRVEPKFECERDSQLIYGEEVKVLSTGHGDYSYIQGRDGLKGYVKSRLIVDGDERKYKLTSFYDAKIAKFPFGSYLSEEDVLKYRIPEELLTPIDNYDFDVVKLSYKFLGIPYLWGGTSDFGYDCSGFVQRLYRFTGIEIPRDAGPQRDFTETVSDFNSAKPGDLIFYEGHVALYLGNGDIIHANGHSASISIDNLFDGSDYSKELDSIFEKIGRVTRSL